MGPFMAAWLVGEGIISYRAIRDTHLPPVPGALLASSGLFAALALLAEAERARGLAVALAWGFDLAAFMNLAPAITGGSAKGAGKQATGTTQAKGTTTAGGRG